MSDTALSPDGAWRWNGSQWVPNIDSRPPAPPPSSSPPQTSYAPQPAQPGLGVVGILALVFVGLALGMIIVQVTGDTIRAFKENPSFENPWYFKFWFEAVELGAAIAGLALGIVTALRTKSALGLIIVILAGGAFMQGFLVMFYRVVVSHFGYGSDLFY